MSERPLTYRVVLILLTVIIVSLLFVGVWRHGYAKGFSDGSFDGFSKGEINGVRWRERLPEPESR